MPGGGRLTLETRNVNLDSGYADRHAGLAPGRYVALLISDTGHGMLREVLEHMFEPLAVAAPIATLPRASETVLLIEDAERALAVASSHAGAIALVITDVVMPGMSGPAAAERLQVLRPDHRPAGGAGQRDPLHPEAVLRRRSAAEGPRGGGAGSRYS